MSRRTYRITRRKAVMVKEFGGLTTDWGHALAVDSRPACRYPLPVRMLRRYRYLGLIMQVTALLAALLSVSAHRLAAAEPPDSVRLPGLAPERSAYDVPINPDLFLIRPGEQLTVTFLQSNQQPLELTVGQDGRLVNSSIGIFDLSGRTLSETRQLLAEPLRKAFRAAEIDIAVGPPRMVGIAIQGAVEQPGVYQLFMSQRVSEAVAAAGGIRADGTRRMVRLVAGNRTLTADLDKAKFLADLTSDPFLYAGRRIIVDTRADQSVVVSGAVRFPGSFELLSSDTAGLLISMAGGLTSGADQGGMFLRNDSTRPVHTGAHLRNGDQLCIPGRLDARSQEITITGAVHRTGRISAASAGNLGAVIQQQGGFTPQANSRRIALFRKAAPSRGSLVHTGAAISLRLPADAKMFGTISLQPGDSVVVPELTGTVTVHGPVAYPGSFATMAGGTVSDYLTAAGGVHSGGKPYRVRVVHPIARLGSPATAATPIEDGDEIHVELEDPATR